MLSICVQTGLYWKNPLLSDYCTAQFATIFFSLHFRMVLWLTGNALVSISEVNLRRARLVLGWVTVSGFNSRCGKNLSPYITSHPGALSLALPPWVDTMSTSQRAVMLCGWEAKAGMVCIWDAIKTVWSPCYHGPYLSTLQMSFFIKCYKTDVTFLCFCTEIHKKTIQLLGDWPFARASPLEPTGRLPSHQYLTWFPQL